MAILESETNPPLLLRDDPRLCDPSADRAALARLLLAVGLPSLSGLVIAKAFLYGTWEWGSVLFLFKLAIVVFKDVLFLLGWLVCWGAALHLARTKCFIRRSLERGFVAASTLLVLYGLLNIWVCSAMRMPLTYALLAMAGDGVELRSSIAPYISPGHVAALAAGVILYLASIYALIRARWPVSAWARRAFPLLLAFYLPLGAYGYVRWYAGGPNEGIAQSAHWTLLRSVVGHLRGESALNLRDAGPESYRDDFLAVELKHREPSQAPRSNGVRNVVLVVLESTGTQFLSVYGSTYPTTPCLQSEAANSLIFRNFYSNAGYTLHSMLPLVVSQYPGTGWEIYSVTRPHLPATSAAQALHDRGYRTAFLTGASLDFRGSRHFFEGRGFDTIRGFEEFRAMGLGTRVSSWGMDDPTLFSNLFDWIGQDRSKPFFAIVWTQQTHHPYTLAPGQQQRQFVTGDTSQGASMLNLYLNDLRIADEQLARLFAVLRQRGLDRSTIVAITGDHAEAFGFPHPWTFHGTSLYQESVNVPLILWSPKLFSHGMRRDEVGAHVDLNPTLFDLLNVPSPADWQGRSLFDAARPPRAYFSCNTGSLLEAVREGNEKYIYNLTLGREELYDLQADPFEQTNIAAHWPARCHAYRQRLSAWTAFEREHLKALAASSAQKP